MCDLGLETTRLRFAQLFRVIYASSLSPFAKNTTKQVIELQNIRDHGFFPNECRSNKLGGTNEPLFVELRI